jgi:hypothetical protein
VNVYAVAAVWIGMALAASLISIRIGVSVALVDRAPPRVGVMHSDSGPR